jgi:excinuclease ABC subunit A
MGEIEIIGAKENNLKNINVNIPINKITVVTGVSGSGKSSLVFDTLYAESERMFLDSMSINNNTLYLKKPNVYKIKNLLPAIAISQKQTNRNPRSTVGTATDISQFIRLLFAKVASIQTKKNWSEGDFSYNTPRAWCSKCKGIGEEYIIDEDKIIDKGKSINEGGIIYWNEILNRNYYSKLLDEVCIYYDINQDIPIKDVPKDKLDFILYGKSDSKFSIRYKNYKNKYRNKLVPFIGLYQELSEKINDIETPSTFKAIQKFLTKRTCSQCNGTRFREEVLQFNIYGRNIYDLHKISLTELREWLSNNINKDNDVNSIEVKVFNEIAYELIPRLQNLEKLKLGYLSLGRNIPSLSGGESQRVRLANQLSCGLSGLLYVLDEPTMGLHVNDIRNICDVLNELKERGNTLVLVEHNAEVMMSADNIIDIGPKGGIYGGEVIFNCSPNELINEDESITGNYLKEYKNNKLVYSSNINFDKYIRIEGATSNNIVNQKFDIPLNKLTVLTGVSGAGKSTFVKNILEPSLRKRIGVNCKSIIGIDDIKKVIQVDQLPIGRSPKSNIATYTGMFDLIRDFFARLPEAKENKITKSCFSFNVDGGRCEKCQGDGVIKIDMSFMPDTYIECDECSGKRYKDYILNIKYNEKNISDVLNMTVIEAFEFFKETKKIASILQCLIDVGLDYVKIGQSALTISGGEAQRIKLAKYLSDEISKNVLYILDEPAVGLHNYDIKKLINLMKKIVNRGNSVVVVDHNVEIIRSADYIIDMGMQGGALGGKVVAMGSAAEIKKNSNASVCNIL